MEKGSALWKRGQPFGKGIASFALEKSMDGQGRGGSRHHPKPFVDVDILYSVFSKQKPLLANLGIYEHISKNNSPDPKGLVKTLDLWEPLVRIEPSAEIHSQPLRAALISILADDPWLNTSSHSGQVWANLKLQRINSILYHVRKLGRENLCTAAAKLNREDFTKLQKALGLLKLEGALEKAPDPQKPLEKGENPREEKPKKLEHEPGTNTKKRKLKQEDSNVSMDSKGFPAMFASSPESNHVKQKEQKSASPPAAPVAFSRRRPGSLVALEKDQLQDALGLGKMKKPAAALEKAAGAKDKAGKAAALGKAAKVQDKVAKAAALGKAAKVKKPALEKAGTEIRKPWVKIRKVNAKKPARSYLIGTTIKGHTLRLIVEVSSKRCPDGYSQVVDTIWESLEKDHLTKQEAQKLKESVCKEWGC